MDVSWNGVWPPWWWLSKEEDIECCPLLLNWDEMSAASFPPIPNKKGSGGDGWDAAMSTSSSGSKYKLSYYLEGSEGGNRKDPRPPVVGGESPAGLRGYCEYEKMDPLVPFGFLHGEGGGDGPAIMGSVEGGGSPCYNFAEGGLTPPPIRWSESLRNLLGDPVGVQLFQLFLQEECGSCEPLNFWFACNGMRDNDQLKSDQVEHLVSLIWKRFIRNFVVRVCAKTHDEIGKRIQNKQIGIDVFDAAQLEVEEEMSRSTYANFLKSELYLSHLALSTSSLTQPRGGVDDPLTPSGHSPTSPFSMDVPTTSGGGPMDLSCLPTLHEDYEYDTVADVHPIRLTSGALAATARQRAVLDRGRSDVCAGPFFGNTGRGINPYHAKYSSALAVSRQDSELQSLSSDAHTDDTLSCTDSSVDGMSAVGFGRPVNAKYVKRHHQKMRENARQNRELALASYYGSARGGGGGACHLEGIGTFLPRTHLLQKESIPKWKPEDFASQLIKRLEEVKRDREKEEKIFESFKKIQEDGDATDESLRQHAFNSLPPSLLLEKLAQKIPFDDGDPSQSILDNHVSRIWQDSNNDTPAKSPASPRPASPPSAARRFQPTYSPYMFNSVPPHSSHLPVSSRHLSSPLTPVNSGIGFSDQPGMIGSTQERHSRGTVQMRRVPVDLHSTFSSDSGTVPDYCENIDARMTRTHMPKTRSMPEYMEAYSVNIDGGHVVRRHGAASGKRANRRPTGELTDSGVSVVSDVAPVTPPVTSHKVTAWLSDNAKMAKESAIDIIPSHRSTPSRSTQMANDVVSPSGVRRSGVRKSSAGSHGSVSASSSMEGTLVPSGDSFGDRQLGGGGQSVSGHHIEEKRGSRSSLPTPGKPPSGQSPLIGHAKSSTHLDVSPMNNPVMSPAVVVTDPAIAGMKKKNHRPISTGSSLPVDTSGVGGGVSWPERPSENTPIVYNFFDDPMPYVIRVATRQVTLKRFKQHLPKKGNYRYFFKKQCDEFGIIQEEITDEGEILPLFEGKIFALIRKAD